MARSRKPATGGGSGELATYEAKRHFDRTPEPRARLVHSREGRAFLIQKHAARRLHYDFRLEFDGVLKSWAVTKGPSLDPSDKRLAVHVEDHPLAYGSFEGSIPAGEYGAGTVMLWDRGTWEPIGDPEEGYAKGHLKFILHGDHLRGYWVLVRMRGRPQDKGRDNWLLIKERDEYARPGEGDALIESIDRSVASGKTMEELANPRRSRVWHSNRADSAEPPPKRSRAKPPDPSKIAGARRGKLPDFVEPELATLVDGPPEGDAWLHEIKIDGYRAFCRRDGDKVQFLTRRKLDWTDRFGKPLVDAIAALPGKAFALDGEIAVLDERGKSNFGDLQEALSTGRTDRLSFVVFDLLYLDGYDMRGAALRDRKEVLRKLLRDLPSDGRLRYSDHVDAPGAEVYRHACDLKVEGIVSKRADAPYQSGRSRDWLKIKCVQRQEFVIGGFTMPKPAGRAGVGSILVGYYEGKKLRYAGHVGTGFTLDSSRGLRKLLERRRVMAAPFDAPPPEARRGAIWVRPDLVCEVEFGSWTNDRILRHASFQGLREDKQAESVTLEIAMPGLSPPPSAAPSAASLPPKRRRVGRGRASNGASARPHDPTDRVIAGVEISHPDREIFPGTGITKERLARYYSAVADFLLPEIANRPLAVLRCPTGIGGQCFFQKHFATGAKSLPRITIEESEGPADYLYVRDAHDLIALVQEGAIEFHPWGARADDPDKPDRLIFDLDPDPKLEFSRVVEAARLMKNLLEQLGLQSFAKTTGGKGLHVVVPFRRGPDWNEVKEVTRALAATLATARPADFTVSPMKRDRPGKIFVDYLRNDRGSTAVAAYTVRARPGAPVAMPLDWSQVMARLRADRYDLSTVPGLVAARKTDPWRALYRSEQRLSAAVLRDVMRKTR